MLGWDGVVGRFIISLKFKNAFAGKFLDVFQFSKLS